MARRLLCPDFENTLSCSQSPSSCIDDIICPPPVPSDPSNSTTVQLSGHHFPPLLLAGATLISTAILLSVVCVAFLALRSCRRRRRLLQQHQQQEHHFVPPPPGADQDDGFFDEELGQPHHVWLIRTVGLDESVIKAIDSWSYKAGEGLVDGTDCAVCLGEFKDGELLKLLPKCSHAFHVPCIDTWLRSHVNCPLCRAPIVAIKPNPLLSSSSLAVTGGGGGSSRSSDGSSSGATVNNATDQGSQTLARSENAQIELQASEVDHGVLSGNEEDLGVEGRAGIVIDSLGIPFSPPESNVAEPSDVGESGFQPVRRSVSMDSLPLGVLTLREGSAESFAEERKEPSLRAERMDKIKEKKDKLRKGKKGLMGMERSLSSSGRWLFFSRHGRMARSSTILPL